MVDEARVAPGRIDSKSVRVELRVSEFAVISAPMSIEKVSHDDGETELIPPQDVEIGSAA